MQLGFHDGSTIHRRGGCADEDRSDEELVNELYRRKACRNDRKTGRDGIKAHCEKRSPDYQPKRSQNGLPAKLIFL